MGSKHRKQDKFMKILRENTIKRKKAVDEYKDGKAKRNKMFI